MRFCDIQECVSTPIATQVNLALAQPGASIDYASFVQMMQLDHALEILVPRALRGKRLVVP